ncbi:hypothetical protein [Labilibaculum sp.]|uniref:hypothetical protein n=1 Tax=Labilibaculum sp. TaxID=2060723 RepID=UPI002AA7F3FC|nr:hypothetical protein [Labilibaculum sp.]
MLDTVIKIGKLYREAPDAHKYHEQINHVWSEVENLRKQKNKDGNPIDVVFYELPVLDKGDSFEFDFDNLMEIEDEDKQKGLYRLNFKTSSNDATSKYLFGDIVHSFVNEKKKNGNIVTDDKGSYKLYSKSDNSIIEKPSFIRCNDFATKVENPVIYKFRNEFNKHILKIHSLFKVDHITILHFKFNEGSWLQLSGIVKFIDSVIAQEFVEKSPKDGTFILKKSLYKSLIGGEHNYYGGIPNFNREKNAYKGRTFSEEELMNIVYAKKAYANPTINCGAYKVNVMPYHDTITKDILEDFYSRDSYALSNEIKSEINIINEFEEENPFDNFFAPMLDKTFHDKTTFDVTFIWFNGTKKSYEDFVEVGTMEQSLIKKVALQVLDAKNNIKDLSEKDGVLKHPYKTNILNSLKNLLANVKRGDSFLNSHYLNIIPKIYTNTYYQDIVLLPSFIEQLELKIRDAEKHLKLYEFYILKYDFYFLMNIQKNNNLMKITETKSYALGKNLGIMAEQFAAWRKDCPIKSFEKAYVGNLSRRITTIDELVKFSGFINEKLTIHGRLYPDVKNAYLQLVETINLFEGEKYNRNNCALGFFESYYGKTNSNNEQQNN